MHDITRRRELAQQLRWLFTGRISNDEFDDFLVDSGCPRSHDRMIVAIADWAWTQYSDTFPYHLTGKNAASDELKSTAARCILMLRSDSEYLWPDCRPTSAAIAFQLIELTGWLGAIATVVIAAFAWINNVAWVGAAMLAPKLLSLIISLVKVGYLAGQERRRIATPLQARWLAAGDQGAWPFVSKTQLCAGARRGHLLGAS